MTALSGIAVGRRDLLRKPYAVQDGVKQTEVDSYVAQQFRQADTDGDGQVTFEDFCEYYQAMSISRARLELRSTMGMEAEREATLHYHST